MRCNSPRERKQEVQNFPGRNELCLFRKKPSVAEIEGVGNSSRYDLVEVGSGQIMWGSRSA